MLFSDAFCHPNFGSPLKIPDAPSVTGCDFSSAFATFLLARGGTQFYWTGVNKTSLGRRF
jgi:hypothetical protein